MEPLEVKFVIVPSSELDALNRRCTDLADRADSLERQLDGLRNLYVQCLDMLKNR